MMRIVAWIVLATAAVSSAQDIPDGMPFGRVGDTDVDRLYEFALGRGFDFKAEMARVYCCDKTIDEDALGRVFIFSRQFTALDKNARTYGQIIYSSLLRIGEVMGVDHYVKIIDRQPPDVQQRIRDFLFYPFTRHPKARSEEALNESRDMYPGLFPKHFQFGQGDPIFANET